MAARSHESHEAATHDVDPEIRTPPLSPVAGPSRLGNSCLSSQASYGLISDFLSGAQQPAQIGSPTLPQQVVCPRHGIPSNRSSQSSTQTATNVADQGLNISLPSTPRSTTSSIPSLTDITELEEQLDPYIMARLPTLNRPVDGEVFVVFRGYMPGVYRSRQVFGVILLCYMR